MEHPQLHTAHRGCHIGLDSRNARDRGSHPRAHLVGARVAHVCAIVLGLEVVVEVPDGHGLVPDLDHGDAQALHHAVHHAISPAALHQHLLGGVAGLQLIAGIQGHVLHSLQSMLGVANPS